MDDTFLHPPPEPGNRLSPTGEAALVYAARGWPVLPLHSVNDHRCSCANPTCSSPGKHPVAALARHGVKDATTDPATIRQWWSQCPEANVGIATGAVSGIVVLDIDPRHGGDESLTALEREHGTLPATPESKTGGGGRQIFFAHPGFPIRNATGVAPGLDVRADGGYVVASPSTTVDQYAWTVAPEDAQLALLSDWLRTLITERPNVPRNDTPGDTIPEGTRNTTLTSLAGTMRRRGMSEDAITAALLVESARRCHPPLPEEEIRKIGASVGRYPKGTPEDRAQPHGNAHRCETGVADGTVRDSAGGAAGGGVPRFADLLQQVEALVRRYVVLGSDAQAVAVTLWVAHAHVVDAFDVTPYLIVTSPEKRSGKTRLLEVLAGLVPEPWLTVRPSEAVVFRKIERDHPTLLLDETDAIFRAKRDPSTEGLRALLNAGNRREAVVSRCQGQSQNLVDFEIFCPKVLAGIGQLPDTVADRGVPIRLERKKQSESVARFRRRVFQDEAAMLGQALASWAHQAEDALRVAEPNVPEALNDRAAEAWESLLAIADLAGGDWPERARVAACALHGGTWDVESIGITLLRAISEIFDDKKTDRILTVYLLAALVERETEPWGGWWGRAVDTGETRGPGARLAALLRPFGVAPKTMRVNEERGKGYERAGFDDAFQRYLTLPPRSEVVTTGQAQSDAAFRADDGRAGLAAATSLESAEGPEIQGLSRCHGPERGGDRGDERPGDDGHDLAPRSGANGEGAAGNVKRDPVAEPDDGRGGPQPGGPS